MNVKRSFAENPILVRLCRGGRTESVHRGAWVLVDGGGRVLQGSGSHGDAIFARSAVKCLQALPLVESGAAERFGYDDGDLALALSSHNGEAQHTERVQAILGRLGLTVGDLLCGTSSPGDRGVREALLLAGEKPSAMHHFCSGKHVGFLALAAHLDVAPGSYLDPESAGQQAVRQALLDMTGISEDQLTTAIDGCSAPTFRFPLVALARAFARFTTPDGLGAERRASCERMIAAVRTHPELIAGGRRRLCTALSKVSKGRLFPKVGAEGVYVVGRVGHDQALAVKMDDGGQRGVQAVAVELMKRLEWLSTEGFQELSRYRAFLQRNEAGIEVGTLEVEL